MDKKSPPKADPSRAGKILIAIFITLILVSAGITYYKTMIKKDYVVENQIDCDPYTEACFIWKCDPASTEEGEACTSDPESNIWYYKIARRVAANIPLCDPATDETCDPWTCPEGEKDCSQTLCDETTGAEQGVECNDPGRYTIDNPVEEEESGDESVCDPETDETCAADESAQCEEGDDTCAPAADDSAGDQASTKAAGGTESGE